MATATHALARGYSYSDRVRYCWPDSQIDDAFERLNLRNPADEPLPLPLISQYFAVAVRKQEKFARALKSTPRELIINHIQDILQLIPRRLRRRITTQHA